METLINLEYLGHISFGDSVLLKEMLEEWKNDTNLKIQELSQCLDSRDQKKIFRLVHVLKTNFFMIGSAKLIHECESFLNSMNGNYDINSLYIIVEKGYEEIIKELSIQ